MVDTTFWEKFSFDYRLDVATLFTELIAIEAFRQSVMNLVLSPEWRTQLDKLNRVRAVYGTTALEGNPLSESEVSHQMELIEQEENTLHGTVTREQLQIRNAARAQAWIKKRFAPGNPPIGLEDILAMHKMVTERSDETHNIPGELRTFPVQVGSPDMGGVHKGAPHGELLCLMEDLISFINSPKLMSAHPVIRGLLGHFFLVTIHPFGDGNSRVSRLLEAGMLFQNGYNVHGFYGLSNFFYRNEGDYKILLQKCRKRHPFDVAPFISFGVKGFISELAGINNFIKAKVNRVIYRQMLVANHNKYIGIRRRILNLREYRLLIFLLDETEPIDPFSENPSRRIQLLELRESSYVKAAYRDVTHRTFIRELSRLSNLGFIKFTNGRAQSSSTIVELDFEANAKYQIS